MTKKEAVNIERQCFFCHREVGRHRGPFSFLIACPTCRDRLDDPQPEVLAEGWAWPLEPKIDEYGNQYFCIYLDGPQSEADYAVTITKRKERA